MRKGDREGERMSRWDKDGSQGVVLRMCVCVYVYVSVRAVLLMAETVRLMPGQ